MTLSFLSRIADRYQVGALDVLAALVEVDGRLNLVGGVRPDSEVYLNGGARERLAALSGVPQERLRRALPAWAQYEPRQPYGAGPAGMLHHGVEKVSAQGPACPGCTAARTGRTTAARQYLAPHQRICARHRLWLMAVPGTGGRLVDLRRCPEVVEAQHRHLRLLGRCADGERVFAVARAVTASWWAQSWPHDDAWSRRLEAASAGHEEEALRWRAVARDMVTYPEAVTVATVLADPAVRAQVAADTRGHPPFSLADTPGLVAALSDGLARPWLAHQLPTVQSGPLYAWAHACVRAAGSRAARGQRTLWQVHSAHRPRPLAEDLAALEDACTGEGGRPVAKRLRGHSRQAEDAFATGARHARAYHLVHGHLATRADTVINGFALGQWTSNQRARQPRMPPEHAAVLSAIDPWWAVPWTTLWQRSYHHARTHVSAHGPLKARQGFPGTSYGLGEWLYQQCTRYGELHPEQQRLLATIGIDQAAAHEARPRRRSIRAHGEEALAHAQAYAAANAGLVSVTAATVHEGFPLGTWLTGQRARAGRGDLSPERTRALAAIDPWWRPIWGLNWQRSYQRTRDHLCAAGSDDPAARWNGLDLSARTWLRRQCLRFDALHVDQQRLLSEIGIPLAYVTAHRPRPKPPVRASKPDRTVERPRPGTGGPRPSDRPDQRARVDAALAQARSWAAVYGHLAVPRAARPNGFPLGEWLLHQRNQATQRARLSLPPSPRMEQLTAIDPWWNPPWKLNWQRNYYRARDHQRCGRPFDPAAGIPAAKDALGIWVRRQCTAFATLHPGQQQLLAAIGITAETARRRTGPRSSRRLTTTPQFDTDVVRARAYAAEHGHLVPAATERYNGFPIGRWLHEHRQRADKTGNTSPQARALTAIDPWWNPPWPLPWQRNYRRAEAVGGPQHPHTPHSVRKWVQVQRSCWPVLHPQQQQLLARIGITAAAAPGPQRPGRNPPGLKHATAHAAANGHLAVATHATHDGFPLGKWLIAQRAKARSGQLSPATQQALTAIDPWWNPPWDFTWQHTYQRVCADTTTPQAKNWIQQQQQHWARLHPEQQTLLTALGAAPP